MEYLAITIIAIALTIFIVYKIANSVFGLGLKLKPLLLCAVCALFISIILPRIVVGFAGLAGTIGVLAVFAVIFAYFVAYYDEAQEPQISSLTAAAAIIPDQGSGTAEDVGPLLNTGAEETASMLEPCFFSETNHSDEEIVAEIATLEISEVFADADVLQDIVSQQDEIPMPVICQKDEEVLPHSLDELLDLAFSYKEQLNFSDALKCFREALKRYPESEASPYIVVEIANILKNRGSYDEAITVFTEGRNLPGLQPDSVLAREFTDTIAYLRIIRNILLHRRLGFIPFNKIPSDVFQDIDTEFREWRNLA